MCCRTKGDSKGSAKIAALEGRVLGEDPLWSTSNKDVSETGCERGIYVFLLLNILEGDYACRYFAFGGVKANF